MQETTDNYNRAISGAAITWVPPQLRVDWDRDGYAGPGSLDDLSGTVGRPIVVNHYLDDGLPNEVSFVAGLGTAELNAPLPAAPVFPAAATVRTRDWVGILANGAAGDLGGTVTAPAGAVRAGDRLYLAVSTGSTTPSVETPDGWTVETGPTDDGVVLRSTIYSREATEDDEAGFDTGIVLSTANRYTAVLVALYGVGAGGGVGLVTADADTVNETVSGTSHVTPTVTATNRQSVVLSVFARAVMGSGSWATSPDTQVVQVCGADPANNNAAVLVALSGVVGPGDYSKTATTAGAVGNATMAAVVVSVRQTDPAAAGRYYSPFNTASPVYAYPRDTAPVKLDLGVVTAGGIEQVRVFTGQMSNLRVRGQTAELEGISRRRLLLSKLIQPPPIWDRWEGLYSAWPVSWAMAQCGIYASPPPRAGARLWAPMHGSLRPFLPYHPPGQGVTTDTGGIIYLARDDASGSDTVDFPEQVDGPYVSAMYAHIDDTEALRIMLRGQPLQTDTDSVDLLSVAGNTGRFEWAVRGDPADINATPAGSAMLFTHLSGWTLSNDSPSGSASVECGVRLTDRVPYITVYDGFKTVTFTSSPALPTDGEWYKVGFGYSFSGSKLWIYNNGTVTSSGGLGLSTAGLPDADDWGEVPYPTPLFGSYLPVAELHITSGVEADPDSYPWVWEDSYEWEVGAQIVPSEFKQNVLAERQPREAWEFIGEYAQGELAVLRTDELDVVRYLTRRWWTQTAQQTISEVLSTTRNVAQIEVDYDPSKVRNSIRVAYKEKIVTTNRVLVFSLAEAWEIPLGTTTYRVLFNQPVVYVYVTTVNIFTESSVELDVWRDFAAYGMNFATFNTAEDGTGTYLTSAQVSAVVNNDWDANSVTITITNSSGGVCYLANDGSTPFFGIWGLGVQETDAYAVATDTVSVAVRGERALPVDLAAVQRSREALQVANALVGDLAWPVATISKTQVLANPARQPGDLVAFDDAATTDADGNWRLVGVDHRADGANYTQQVTVVRALPVFVWDESNWDEAVWE